MKAEVQTLCSAIRRYIDFEIERRREEVPGELFHYTSPEGVIGIVSNRSLWASDMLSLSDTSEVSYPRQLILETAEASQRIPERYRECFTTQLREFLFRMDAPYVACFCEESDQLSQWRGYGGLGEGLAIGFGAPWLLSLEQKGYQLQRVVYSPAQQRDLVMRFLDRVAEITAEAALSEEEVRHVWQSAAMSLTSWVTMFKHPSFSEEREWRIVSEPERRNSRFTAQFRRAGQRIVPYVTVDIRSDLPVDDVVKTAITRVVRGPYFRGADYRGLYFMLVSMGFLLAAGRIEDSCIPFG